MARLIDGDALIAWIKGGQQMTSKMKSIICYIKTMPTIDAVSVVRCKDCEHMYDGIKNDGYLICHKFNYFINADDFCSYGERKNHGKDNLQASHTK